MDCPQRSWNLLLRDPELFQVRDRLAAIKQHTVRIHLIHGVHRSAGSDGDAEVPVVGQEDLVNEARIDEFLDGLRPLLPRQKSRLAPSAPSHVVHANGIAALDQPSEVAHVIRVIV